MLRFHIVSNVVEEATHYPKKEQAEQTAQQANAGEDLGGYYYRAVQEGPWFVVRVYDQNLRGRGFLGYL